MGTKILGGVTIMKYYRHNETGEVYAYESEQERQEWGAPELVEMTQAEIEAHLNPPKEPIYKTHFSVLEFRDRFTIQEQLAIRQAQFQDMEVGLVYDSFQAAQFIDVQDPRVEQGIDLYISKGLLAAERKEALLEPELIE